MFFCCFITALLAVYCMLEQEAAHSPLPGAGATREVSRLPPSPCREEIPREGPFISSAFDLLLCSSTLWLPPLQFSLCCLLAGLFGFSGQHDDTHRHMPFSCPMSAWLRVASLQPVLQIFPGRKTAPEDGPNCTSLALP